MAIKETGGSLLVKLATAEPVLIRSPQSSTICAITATGQPAGAENPVPTEVKHGQKFGGNARGGGEIAKMRGGRCRYRCSYKGSSAWRLKPPEADVTVCVVESLNASVTVPG